MSSRLERKPEQKDELLTILADDRRRAILAFFRDADDAVATVRELATHVDGRGHGDPGATPIQLVHSDLPRLEEAGVVGFDQRSEAVRYQGSTELERLLAFVEEL